MPTVSVHDFLWNPAKFPAQPVCVVFGKEPFLKYHATRLLRRQVLSGEDAEMATSRFDGNTAKLDGVLKELATMSMFGGERRLVILEDADPFVSKNRDAMESYVGHPSKFNVLVLQLDEFPATTRLFKKVAETGLIIEAKPLPEKDVASWVVKWAKQHHRTKCEKDAAAMLVERVGVEHGLLDQELLKLSGMVAPGEAITVPLVEQAVGSWRMQTVFQMLNKALDGNPAEAIRLLDRLLATKEKEQRIFNAIVGTLRIFASATQLILDAEKSKRTLPVRDALLQAGANRYYVDQSEQQLKNIGRFRGKDLNEWLLDTDLKLKGKGRKENYRLAVEILIIRLADPKLKAKHLG